MNKQTNAPIIGILTDTAPLNMLIDQAVTEAGFLPRIFDSNTADIIAEITEARLSCLFLKTRLSNLGGLELTSRLRGNSELSRMKIVFLSADKDVAEQALEYRANHFLNIPFQKADVRQALERLVQVERTILYAEDSLIIRQAVTPELEKAGYRILPALNGREALDVLAREIPDILITDIEMPELDGFGLCRQIKSSPEYRQIPVIITSTLDSQEAVDRGFGVGANDYLIKPFVIPELLSRIRLHIEGSTRVRPDRILVVDPDEVSRNMILHALRNNGFAPDEARNGRIALSRLRHKGYHILITAYQMPVMDGYELIMRLREDPRLLELPVLMIGSRENTRDQIRVTSLGVSAYIAPPFGMDRLLSEVERILAVDRLEREHSMLRHYLTDEAIRVVTKAAESGEEEIAVEDAFRTVFFTDIEKFTPLCENLPSHLIVDFLNRYFDEMVRILDKYKASIDKFIGDAIMALFDGEEDGAHRAVCAGLEMIAALEKVRADTGRDIHMRVGMNSGHVILGDIGSRLYRRDYTVIGDNVNTAQRLESNAGRDGVLISGSTYDLISDLVEATPRELSLKGKKEIFSAYQVHGVRPYEFS